MFDESENIPFEVPTGRINAYDKKSVPDAPKLYILQENKSTCVFCSLSNVFYVNGDKIVADCF